MGRVPEYAFHLFINANNNLAAGAQGLLRNQLAKLKLCDRVSVDVEYSHLRDDPSYLHPGSIRHGRAEVSRDGLRKLEDLPVENMADPKILKRYLAHSLKRYPGRRHVVVFIGHTQDWHASLPDTAHRVSPQGKPVGPVSEMPRGGDGNYPSRMSVIQMADTLREVERESGVRPVIVAFDSCLGSNLELAYQMRDRADLLLASEDVVSSPPWQDGASSLDFAVPLKDVLQNLSDRLGRGETVEPDQLAHLWVDACSHSWTTPTQTALRLADSPQGRPGIARLAEAVDGLAGSLLELPVAPIRRALSGTRHFGEGKPAEDSLRSLVDLGDLLTHLAAQPELESARPIMEGVRRALAEVRVAHRSQQRIKVQWRLTYGEPQTVETVDYPARRTQGVSVYLPRNPDVIRWDLREGNDYAALDFARGSRWDELISRVCGQEGALEKR